MASKQLFIGGVLRCCAATLDEADVTPMRGGDLLPCKYCDSGLEYDEEKDAWFWSEEVDAKIKAL